ncbi:hypothetical protein [Streptomyces sp. NPDC096132]|uniref:hypothetical protein n=1 Tax=Streptomyces sp. NPDC096132 TaxID=3366075 RepID=UPI00381008F1
MTKPARPLLFLDGIQGAHLATYDAQLAATWRAYESDHQDLRFTGEFRRELDNITFPGERAAAEKTVETYAVHQSNAHFGAWMTVLDKAIHQPGPLHGVRAGRQVGGGRAFAVGRRSAARRALLTALGLRPRRRRSRTTFRYGFEVRELLQPADAREAASGKASTCSVWSGSRAMPSGARRERG